MYYRLDVKFEPIYELVMSLHTYICRKSYKKIDLSPSWPKEVKARLKPDFAAALDQMPVNGDWNFACILGYLAPDGIGINGFLRWIGGLANDDLYAIFTKYGDEYPEVPLNVFREQTVWLFSSWYDQYFKYIDPAILTALEAEKERRRQQQPLLPADDFVDETTNGMMFKPLEGVDEIILIPQFHFQPLNIVSLLGDKIICHYNSRIYLGDEELIPTPDLRMLRSLSEKSRLKILRFLHQGPRTFTEIVSHMKLSKGITHDHISKLRSAGLIYAHFEGETLIEYSLRIRALHQVQDRLIDYIEER